MLEADRVTKSFSGVRALDGVSIEVDAAEAVGLVGPNGSGKSTLLNILSGFDRPDRGTVRLDGYTVTGQQPWRIAHRGVRRTFQTARLPEQMSVMELMLSAGHLPRGSSLGRLAVGPRAARREEADVVERARTILRQLGMEQMTNQAGGRLSGGQQKLLSLGMTLMGEPTVLMLDEPTAGVNPTLRHELADHLRALREGGMSILVVEHDMNFIANSVDRTYVLDKGCIIADCAPRELASNQRVLEAYLGSGVSGSIGARHEGAV